MNKNIAKKKQEKKTTVCENKCEKSLVIVYASFNTLRIEHYFKNLNRIKGVYTRNLINSSLLLGK